MRFTTRILSSAFLSVFLWSVVSIPHVPASEAKQVVFADWQPQAGDRFLADTAANVGYLVHDDGRYISFRIVTGQRRWLYYIGRSYYGATPETEWVSLSQDIKGDRITFGPTGRFFRLYRDDGEDKTAYGIHGHRSAIKMLEGEMRYRSMGCIIVAESVLDIVEQTFQLNDGQLSVTTQAGIHPSQTLLAQAS